MCVCVCVCVCVYSDCRISRADSRARARGDKNNQNNDVVYEIKPSTQEEADALVRLDTYISIILDPSSVDPEKVPSDNWDHGDAAVLTQY